MANTVVNGTNIDLSLFSYSVPKAHPTGGKVVNLYNKEAKESLTIAAPLMGAWGAQEVQETDKQGVKHGTGKYTMSLQFSEGAYATPASTAFLEQLKIMENSIKQYAMDNSKDWFGKSITSMDVMDEKFTPMLKYPKMKGSEERDYSKQPTLTVKLPCWKDVWQTSVFDVDYNPLYVKGKSDPDITPLTFLTSTSKAPIQVSCLLQCGGIWFVGNPSKVSITWNLKQVVVQKPKMSSIPDDTCFLTLSESDRAALVSQSQTEVVDSFNLNDLTIGAEVVDDDEDDRSAYVSAPTSTPVPVVAPVVAPPVAEPVVSVPETVAPAAVPKKKVVKKAT